jgi:hypothetical protein
MIQEGTKKPAGTRAQAVYQNDDFHRPVQIAQVENRIGDVDQRSRRYQYGGVERFAPRMLDCGWTIGDRKNLVTRGLKRLSKIRL